VSGVTPNLLQRIVTPAFVAFNSHCWFAAFWITVAFLFQVPYAISVLLAGAALKEFYVDKHFENGQTFWDNMVDWLGYFTGVVIFYCLRYAIARYYR
jgi:hypothetical protein